MEPRIQRRVLLFLDLGISRHVDLSPQGRILKCNTDGSSLTTLLDGITNLPDGLVMDSSNGYIYFTQMGPPGSQCGQISRFDLTKHETSILVPQGVTWSPKQITMDQTVGRLYWADREGGKIWSCGFEGEDVRIEIQVVPVNEMGPDNIADMAKWCVGVAVDPRRRKLYWTQKGAPKSGTGSLWCADLDMPTGEVAESRNDKVLLLEDLPEPIDLDFDVDTNILYMSDRGEIPFGNTISRLDLNGVQEGLETEIIVEKLHEGVGIAHDRKQKRIYITDLMGSLYAANEDGTDKQVLHRDVGELAGIIVCDDWQKAAMM